MLLNCNTEWTLCIDQFYAKVFLKNWSNVLYPRHNQLLQMPMLKINDSRRPRRTGIILFFLSV
jgi:hypothetical protein